MNPTYIKTKWWAFVLLFIVFTLSYPAMAAENGGIGGKPANPRADNPRTESIFVYELKPGDSVKDEIEVYNNTELSKTINVYATDSVVSSGGGFACAQAVDEIKDVGSWITLSKNQVSLNAGAKEKIAFNVSVPNYAEPGEHNGCIAIQEADVESANVGNGIALSFRSAIRVAITVPGTITKELTIRDVTLKDKNNKLVGTILLRNNGNVSLDTKISSFVSSLTGRSSNSIEGTYPALPQTVTELNFEFDKPSWGGFYRLNSKSSYNSNTQDSLGEGSPSKDISQTSSYIFVVPNAKALFVYTLILVVLFSLGWLLVKRYLLVHKDFKNYVDYTVLKEDDIKTIAEKSNISWEHLARVNKIKAPYLVSKGQIIKVPKTDDKISLSNTDLTVVKKQQNLTTQTKHKKSKNKKTTKKTKKES